MPYLNWRETSYVPNKEINCLEGPREKSHMKLGLSRTAIDELIPQLEAIFHHQGSELRVDLPDQWAIFFKSRDSESRLLVAHPQQGEWVSTVALSLGHGSRLLDAVKVLTAGGEVVIGELESVGNVSNLEMTLTLV